MRLFGSEMTRLASRRLFRWILILFIGVLILAAVLVFVNDQGGTYTRSDMSSGLSGLSFPLIMFGWLVGASAIGAEWANRTVSALLTWEPRRTRVLLTKAAAAAVSTGLWVIALQVVWTAVMLPVASGGDEVHFGEPFSWSEYAQDGGRILLVAMCASILGFALATIGRNTGAALGAGMAYLLIVETLVRWVEPLWEKWLLSSNIIRIIGGSGSTVFANRSMAEAVGTLGLYAGGLLLMALWVFRRREMA